jgi:hypothetical protein
MRNQTERASRIWRALRTLTIWIHPNRLDRGEFHSTPGSTPQLGPIV